MYEQLEGSEWRQLWPFLSILLFYIFLKISGIPVLFLVPKNLENDTLFLANCEQ